MSSEHITQPLILDGKEASTHYSHVLASRIARLKQQDIIPGLRVLLVGNNSASQVYTKAKTKKSIELGIDGQLITFDSTITQSELLSHIEAYNADTSVHGILVQLPLPSHLDAQSILQSIAPDKDVDGFHTVNVGRLQKMDPHGFIPCTVLGTVRLLQYYNITVESKHVVIVGRSEIVGRPLAQLLSLKHHYGNATVTLCHSKTKDIAQFTRQAQVLIAAIGIPHYIKKDMVASNTIIVDVGINRVDSLPDSEKAYRLVGDVDFDNVAPLCSAITPVPGGIGRMTVIMLMENTIKSAEQAHGIGTAQFI